MRIPRWSQTFFAVTMIGIGILGLVQGAFTPTWTGVPRRVPGREGLIYLTAVLSLACGVGLLWQRTAVAAARVLAIAFLVWLLFRAWHFFLEPPSVAIWWACGDSLVMLGAAWVLSGDKGLRFARAVYGLGLIPFGVAHFTFLQRTVSLVPGWLPWHTAWAYITGGAFIAAGIAVIAGVRARLAAVLVTLQLALFTLLVWVPIVTAHPTASDWTEFVSSIVLTSAAWVVADSYRMGPRAAG